ncbi:hypothetical protein NMG60_11023116 [Bertholletia excelsa]
MYCLLSSSTMDSPKIPNGEERVYQNVVVMRHGDRLDNVDLTWAKKAARPWDPPLVKDGKVRAFFTGRRLRTQLGFRIHRVFVSPFLRCVQTASEVVSALCALDEDADRNNVDSDGLQIDASKIKILDHFIKKKFFVKHAIVNSHFQKINDKLFQVSIELGLCEMLNNIAIRPDVAPKDGKFGFNISELEGILPAGTVDHSAERVYQELPAWEETSIDARNRYSKIIKALADKFPSENLLLITHGEGVRVSVSALMKNVEVERIHYCAYLHSRRPVFFGAKKSFTAGDFELPTAKAQTGVTYNLLSTAEDDHVAQIELDINSSF